MGTGLPLVALLLAPSLIDGRCGRRTTGLAAMALLNTTIETEGIKFLTGRERPSEPGGRLRFHGPGSGFASFPSGHTSAAFAVAEVVGNHYKHLKLPLYLSATAVGWARINSASHFPSDVLVGAAIGIYNGRLVLRRGGKLHVWN